jgi:signal transduction histidine kinase
MHWSFRTRLIVSSTSQIVGFTVAAVLVLAILTGQYTDRQTAAGDDVTRASFALTIDLHRTAWRRETQEFARSPVLLATAAIPAVDEPTLLDALALFAAPMAAVLDAEGRVIAGRGGFVRGAQLLPRATERGAIKVSDHLWQTPAGSAFIALAPLVQDGELLGHLVRGELLDDRLAMRLSSLAGRDAVLVHAKAVVGSRWQAAPTEVPDLSALTELDEAALPPRGRALTLQVDDQPRPGLVLALHPDGGLAFLAQDLQEVEALRRRALTWLFGCGLLTVLLGILLALRNAARLSQPLRTLVAASDRIGAGDLNSRVRDVPTDDEFAQLAQSFNAMATTVQRLIAEVSDKAARAEAANRVKDAFMASISHELRTPLTGIQSTAELLLQFGAESSEAERTEFLSTILTQAERLGRRISDALDYTSLASGTTQWTLGRVDLVPACREAWRRLESLLALKPVELRIGGASEAILQGDRERITQALQHLLHNAWTWSPPNLAVDITIATDSLGATIEIADRGPGLAPSDRERVFDAFTQGGDPLVDKPNGMGVGLKIAHEVARCHGGTIAYDDRPGGGACFRMSLLRSGRPIDLQTQMSASN